MQIVSTQLRRNKQENNANFIKDKLKLKLKKKKDGSAIQLKSVQCWFSSSKDFIYRNGALLLL